jgi:hypothetical protein
VELQGFVPSTATYAQGQESMMNIIWSWMLDLINQHELLELEERQKFLVYLITSISQHAELN